MRLLVVTTVPATLAGFLLPYAAHLRERGWSVDAATGDEEPVPPSVTAAFDRVHTVPWSRRLAAADNGLRAPLRLRHIAVEGCYDVVHTHTPIASFVTRAALATLPRDRRPAVVYTAHGFHFHPRGARAANAVFASAERVAGRWTDRLVVINDTDREAALRLRLVPPEHLVHLPGIGVDLDHYRPTPALLDAATAFRRSLGVADEVRLFTVVGEMVARKNHRAVVLALTRAPHEVHVCLAGDGPLQARLEGLVASLGLRDRVHFLGCLDDVRPVVLASQATVLPSRQEGLSRAVLESLALGVPVIGGRTRGIAELVLDDAGVLVDPDDVAGLARAFDDVRELPTAGRLRPVLDARLQRYSTEALLAAHDQLYRDVLRDRGPRASKPAAR